MPLFDITLLYRFKIVAKDDEAAVEKALELLPEEEPTINVQEVN